MKETMEKVKKVQKTRKKVEKEPDIEQHPLESWLRMDRIPHIWCSTCGIGTVVTCFVEALKKTGFDRKDVCVVSGIGCSGRVAGYIKQDSFHTTHGRAVPFAVGLKLANPRLKVVVISGDGDISSIGGNHLIHTARRNIDITITDPTSPNGLFNQSFVDLIDTSHPDLKDIYSISPRIIYTTSIYATESGFIEDGVSIRGIQPGDDGFGNLCDADLDNTAFVNFGDLALFKTAR